MPRIAAADAFDAHPASAEDAVGFHGFEKILGARRREAAATGGSAQRVDDRRDESLVKTDGDADEPFHGGLKLHEKTGTTRPEHFKFIRSRGNVQPFVPALQAGIISLFGPGPRSLYSLNPGYHMAGFQPCNKTVENLY